MTDHRPRITGFSGALASILVLAALLGGCIGGPATAVTPSSTASPSPESPPTSTPLPTLLLVGATADSPLGVVVEGWAREHGWVLAARAGPGNEPGLWGVVAVAPEPGSMESILARSELVVIVDPMGIAAGGSVNTIGGIIRRDQAGFLAGALAGLASESGWVGRIDGTGGEAEAQTIYQASFMHGLRYACPGCRLVTAAASEATVDLFRGNGVDVVWAVPGPEADAVLAALAEGGLWVVWAEHAPAGVRPEQIAGGAGFAPEAVVAEALDASLAGEAGRDWAYDVASGSLGFAGLNGDAVSPGRQRLLLEAQEALRTGALDTGIDPQTGQER